MALTGVLHIAGPRQSQKQSKERWSRLLLSGGRLSGSGTSCYQLPTLRRGRRFEIFRQEEGILLPVLGFTVFS